MPTSNSLTYIAAGALVLSLGASSCGASESGPQQPPGQGSGTAGSTAGTTSSLPGLGTSTPSKKPDLSSSTAGGTGPATGEACTPPSKWYVKASCPTTTVRSFGDFPSDCYLSCAEQASICPAGTLCRTVQYDPCLPEFEPGQTTGTQCDACSAGGKLCIPIESGPNCSDFSGVYQTVDEKECGKTPAGVSRCKWSLNFAADGTFSWRFSDISQTGQYFCHGSSIYLDFTLPLGGTGANQSYRVDFDAASKSILWEGVSYHRVP